MFTTNEVILVQASFARLVPMQDAAADLFYGRLFAIAPSLRELFPSDLRDQKRDDADDRHGRRRVEQSR